MATPAVRNNNPGNIKDPSTGQFRVFKSPQEGYEALKNDLTIKMTGKSKTGVRPESTVAEFASIYAPASDKNDPVRYAQNLGKQLGVDPATTSIASLQPRIDDFAKAIAQNEDKDMAAIIAQATPQNLAVAQESSPLAQKIKSKYPQYSDMDDAILEQKILEKYPQYADLTTAQPQPAQGVGGTYKPAPEVKPYEAAQGAEEQAASQKGLAQKGLEFLFPILEKKERTGLQTIGDIGMSILPFIPGAGAAGLLAKGARGARLASKAAKGAKAAKTAGLVSRAARSPVIQGTAAGYGTGVSKNLSEGEGLGEAFKADMDTVGGAALGFAAPVAAKAVGGIINKAAGIPENIKPRLANLSNKRLYDEYANTGAKRAEDVANPSLIDKGVERATKAVDKIQTSLKTVGKEIGDIKKAEGKKALQDVRPVIDDFSKKLQDRFGVSVRVSPTGVISFRKAQGRMKDVLSAADTRRVKDALKDLMKLRKTGNVQRASDALDNLDNAISYGKRTYFGGTDPLNGFLKETRHSLNEVIGKSSPTLAKAKTRASELRGVIDEIKDAGGTNFQRADLLLKRALAGDKGAVPREVFDTIKKETGVDLMDDAILINHFTRSLGDETQMSLLSQYLQRASQQGGTTVPDLLLSAGRSGLMKTVADPVKMGRNIVKGKKGLVSRFLETVPTAAAIEGGRALPVE